MIMPSKNSGTSTKIQALFKTNAFQAVLIASLDGSDPFFNYFTALPLELIGNNFLLLRKGKKPIIYCSNLEFNDIKKRVGKKFQVKMHVSRFEPFERIKKDLKNIQRIGLNHSRVSLSLFHVFKKFISGKKWVDASIALNQLRETKTPSEIQKVKKAIQLSEKVLKQTLSFIRTGISEKDLALRLKLEMERLNVCESFGAIIAFGVNAAFPHYLPSPQVKLKVGDLILIDFGVRFENYCADLTRCFVWGKASEKQREVYEKVWLAHELGFKAIQIGQSAQGAFLNVEKWFGLNGWKQVHGLGHGLGLELHDFPQSISAKSRWKFENDQIVTVEPGVYLEGWGGVRLEDDVLIQNGKAVWLSRCPKKLIELKGKK